jgi:hypothetical protein
MTTDVMKMAILSLDVYHRGYNAGIKDVGTKLGFATVKLKQHSGQPPFFDLITH